ncbi:hypothetical protein BDD12DRAFT_980756 [Trichophaea hybrida]|nr:hypothetical protein BDD12DRAFT_980756 [Trichophaea hybrida]
MPTNPGKHGGPLPTANHPAAQTNEPATGLYQPIPGYFRVCLVVRCLDETALIFICSTKISPASNWQLNHWTPAADTPRLRTQPQCTVDTEPAEYFNQTYSYVCFTHEIQVTPVLRHAVPLDQLAPSNAHFAELVTREVTIETRTVAEMVKIRCTNLNELEDHHFAYWNAAGQAGQGSGAGGGIGGSGNGTGSGAVGGTGGSGNRSGNDVGRRLGDDAGSKKLSIDPEENAESFKKRYHMTTSLERVLVDAS